jgi:hypothetical protein
MELVHSHTGGHSTRNDVKTFRAMTDWSLLGDRQHGVQFYEDDAVLIDLLSRFAGSALVSGDSAVIIATRRHRDALTSRLKRRGFDTAVAKRQGRFVALDAAGTLASFMRNGRPEPLLLGDRMGKVLEAAASSAEDGRRRVVVFGEMVALLWSQGKIEAALQLEELWNRLAELHAFSLCCAYPMQGFAGSAHAAPFLKICAQHSHVFPAEQRRATAASR